MSSLRAVVFDIDGTIIDTSEFILQAYEHVIKKHQFPKRTRQEISSQIGKKIEDCYAFLTPGADFEKLIADHNDFQAANVALVQAFDHVDDVLSKLKQNGIKTALWTGRRHHVVESLEAAGLHLDMFELIVDATDVKHGKPDPEGLLITLERLGTDARHAVMVGDSYLDIAAGKAAQVTATVGITHGFGTRQELEDAGADFLVNNLQELLQTILDIR